MGVLFFLLFFLPFFPSFFSSYVYGAFKLKSVPLIYEIVGPVLLIFVSPSIRGVRTSDKMLQKRAFFSVDEVKQGCGSSLNGPGSPKITEPTDDSDLDDNKFPDVTLITNILVNT